MAECLTWKDLSENTINEILNAKETTEVRRNVRDAFGIQDDGDDLAEIVVDLYYNAIIFALEQKFTMEKLSTVVSIVKAIHEQSTVGRLSMEESWKKTKQILLTHSVQRPPFSVSIFSLGDLQAITHYLLHTYFRYYKMYQYAFMPTYIINYVTLEPDKIEEPPPEPPPLSEEELERIKKEQEKEEARRLEEERLAMEEERKREIEAAYLAAIPDEITQKVIDALAKHLETMKKELNEQIHITEDKVTKKITSIDSKHPGTIDTLKPGSIRGSIKK